MSAFLKINAGTSLSAHQGQSVSAPPSATSFRVLSDVEREASLRASMAHWQRDDDVWVFGYASLIWRPGFDFSERRDGLLWGYHRALCLWSRINRGTPERPGLVFGLDRGGSCRGVVFRITASQVPATMEALWRREMPSGAYLPRWLSCRTPTGRVNALAFTMNRATDAYVRNLPPERLVQVVHNAHGCNGPCLEYVIETAQALQKFNICDQRLQKIIEHLHCPILTGTA